MLRSAPRSGWEWRRLQGRKKWSLNFELWCQMHETGTHNLSYKRDVTRVDKSNPTMMRSRLPGKRYVENHALFSWSLISDLSPLTASGSRSTQTGGFVFHTPSEHTLSCRPYKGYGRFSDLSRNDDVADMSVRGKWRNRFNQDRCTMIKDVWKGLKNWQDTGIFSFLWFLIVSYLQLLRANVRAAISESSAIFNCILLLLLLFFYKLSPVTQTFLPMYESLRSYKGYGRHDNLPILSCITEHVLALANYRNLMPTVYTHHWTSDWSVRSAVAARRMWRATADRRRRTSTAHHLEGMVSIRYRSIHGTIL